MVAAVLGLVLAFGVGLTSAQVGGWCDLFPDRLECQGGGGGGGGSGSTTTTTPTSYYWGGWYASDTCTDGDPRSIRYLLWSDGTYVRPWELPNPPVGAILGTDRVYQLVCSDLPEVSVWGDLVSDIEALPPPVWESSPPEPGITGLETWLWHSGTTTAGPVSVTYTDGTTGRTFTLEGRAWVGTITWETGDGSVVRATALDHSAGGDVGGSEALPAATHTYETSSAEAGLSAGYPVTLSITWVGEWRWREGTAAWTAWQPMLSTVDVTTADLFEVVQIVASLQP